MGARDLIDAISLKESGLKRFDTQIALTDEDDGTDVEVVYDYDNIGEGDVDYAGKKDVAPWIEDVLLDGKSIIDSLSAETILKLTNKAYSHIVGR
jgi:hypothetical protein